MLPLPSGNEIRLRSFRFEVTDLSQVGEARRFASRMAATMSFDETQSGQASIVINELGTNLVRYASKGELLLRACRDAGKDALEILSIDHGPGIPDVERSLRDGVTTGTTPGTGLGAVRRQSDSFDIYSTPRGTVIYSLIQGKRSATPNVPSRLRLGVVCLPVKSEDVSGDTFSVLENDENISILVADGLGHGPKAHEAAAEAVNAFEQNPTQTIEQQMQTIHGRLKSTRGAAVSMARILKNAHELTFVGVGNVRGVVVQAEQLKGLVSHAGTAGLQFRHARPMTAEWSKKSVLIIHTDGLMSRWDLKDYPGILSRHPGIVAATLYRDFVRGTDDVTILVGGNA